MEKDGIGIGAEERDAMKEMEMARNK